MQINQVRCRCEFCFLTYVRDMPEWQRRNYELRYRVVHETLIVPCNRCAMEERARITRKFARKKI